MTIKPEQLHVIRCYDRLPPQPGGMERHIAELTAAQRRLGVRVTEVFNSGAAAGEAVRISPRLRTDRMRPNLLRWGFFYGAAAASRFDLSDGRVRVLHIHGDWPAFLLGRLLQLRLRPHGMAASLHSSRHAPLAVYTHCLSNFDPIFTTGRQQSHELSASLGRRVIQLPSAPADRFFAPSVSQQPSIDVIAVGSLLPVKQLDTVLSCAALRPQLRFAIIGEGPERARLEALKNALGLTNVVFRGAVPADEVPAAFAGARLFINTSRSEGSPTAALEAMACGLPVVLTPANDYSSIVENGVNGIVTRSWDPNELAQALDFFLEHGQRLAPARQAARATAGQHRWEAKAQTVIDAMIDAVCRNVR